MSKNRQRNIDIWFATQRRVTGGATLHKVPGEMCVCVCEHVFLSKQDRDECSQETDICMCVCV